MEQALASGFGGLLHGILSLTPAHALMLVVGCFLLYMGIARGAEPLLLVPIGFGAVLVNIPGSTLMDEGGVLRTLYEAGILTRLFPVLIFLGVGAMIDFGPLFANPRILLLGVAGQFGIFITLMLALVLGFELTEAVSIAMIGGMDGPSTIFVSSTLAPHMLGAVSVAAYSYMALVPLVQPPIMRLLTTEAEKKAMMTNVGAPKVSRRARILFPIVVVLIGGLIAPQGLPLLGTLMLGNLLRESGVVERLKNASQNEISNIVTLLLGITIGASMQAELFVRPETLMVFGLGLVAIVLATTTGVLFGKLFFLLSRGKVNPFVGAAGIAAYPIAARVVQVMGQRYNRKNHLLMHAMGANTGGQLGSIMAAAVILSVLAGMGITGP